MKSSDLDYKLPESLIAQYPAEKRDASRLMVIDRDSGRIQLDVFENMPDYLHPGDCLALNDTRVIRARLHGRKETGGAVEIFLLQELSDGGWSALVRPSAKVRAGARILFPADLEAVVAETLPGRMQRVFSVINSLTDCGSTVKVSGRISANTGIPPAFTMAPAVAKKVKGDVMTSSPG